MTFLVQVTALCAAIIAVSGAAAVLHKIPWVRKQWDAFQQSRKNTHRAELAKIMAELSPNSGHSMRDAVNRIEKRQIKADDKMTVLSGQVQELRTDLGYGDGP